MSDLVHASLDLPIDEECGIWHLVNDGAVSWYDFGEMHDPDVEASPCGSR